MKLRAAAPGAACVIWLLGASGLLAHGDVHEQIEALTKRIATEPRNAELHLRRGELFRVHGETDRALADYRDAERLDASLDAVDLCRARALIEAHRAKEAQAPLARAAAKHPGHEEVLLLSARAADALGEHARAVALWPRALEASKAPAPDLFVEGSRAFVAAGRPDDALAILERGRERLGAPPSLETAALDLELSLGRTDAALARLDRLAASAPRPEAWLARRAEVLEKEGRAADARASYESALRALDALPPRLRAARATAALEESVRAGLARVGRS